MMASPSVAAVFLSTPSVRRATSAARTVIGFDTISIHALREEGDTHFDVGITISVAFLSTPSVRRATTAAQAPDA